MCCHTWDRSRRSNFLSHPATVYTDSGPASPSTAPITPGAWQGSHWSATVEVTGLTDSWKEIHRQSGNWTQVCWSLMTTSQLVVDVYHPASCYVVVSCWLIAYNNWLLICITQPGGVVVSCWLMTYSNWLLICITQPAGTVISCWLMIYNNWLLMCITQPAGTVISCWLMTTKKVVIFYQ